jgi:hypothetical protein
MNVKNELMNMGITYTGMSFNDINVEPEKIKAMMINEVVPADERDDFYGSDTASYLTTIIPLFQQAEVDVESIQDILDLGIYITNAVKLPKSEYAIDSMDIERSLSFLKKEISLFPNLKVIILNGDVAKKAYNKIRKEELKKNIVPVISTYKLRTTEIYDNNIRIFPSYIITGKNILIEKSKFQMVSEDITKMIEIIK